MQHKRQKLSKKKVSQFTGFHSNIRKTFAGLTSSALKVLKKAIAQKIHRENFRALSKIRKNCKTFLPLNFFHLWHILPELYYTKPAIVHSTGYILTGNPIAIILQNFPVNLCTNVKIVEKFIHCCLNNTPCYTWRLIKDQQDGLSVEKNDHNRE